MNWKGQGVTKKCFSTLPILGPKYAMKTNVQQLIRKKPLLQNWKEIIEIALIIKDKR